MHAFVIYIIQFCLIAIIILCFVEFESNEGTALDLRVNYGAEGDFKEGLEDVNKRIQEIEFELQKLNEEEEQLKKEAEESELQNMRDLLHLKEGKEKAQFDEEGTYDDEQFEEDEEVKEIAPVLLEEDDALLQPPPQYKQIQDQEEDPLEEEEEIFAIHHEDMEKDAEEYHNLQQYQQIPEIPQRILKIPSTKPSKLEEFEKVDQKFGVSLDSAKVDNAIGLLDLKEMCKGLAHALFKHIEFSQGKATMQELGFSHSQQSGKFNYDLNKMLDINLSTSKFGFKHDNKKTEEEKSQTPVDSSSMLENTANNTVVSDESQLKDEKRDEVHALGSGQRKSLNKEELEKRLIDSFSTVTGQPLTQDLLNSYLTLEFNLTELNDDDIDLSYSQTHIDDFIASRKHKTKLSSQHFRKPQRIKKIFNQLSNANRQIQALFKEIPFLKSTKRQTAALSINKKHLNFLSLRHQQAPGASPNNKRQILKSPLQPSPSIPKARILTHRNNCPRRSTPHNRRIIIPKTQHIKTHSYKRTKRRRRSRRARRA